jgi:hypothetical protein
VRSNANFEENKRTDELKKESTCELNENHRKKTTEKALIKTSDHFRNRTMLSRQRMNEDPESSAERAFQKAWCFTYNHYTIEDIERILDFVHGEFKTNIQKVVIGKEIAPTTGTPHLQGYIKFTSKKRLWNLTTIWGKGSAGKAHWEPARGSEQKNLEYCIKGQNVLVVMGFHSEKAELAKSGTLKGHEYWEAVVSDAYQLSAEEFAQKWPKEWLIRRGAVERLMLDSSKKSMRVWSGNLQLKNVWLWGEPGVGKSKWAHRQETGGDTLFKNLNRWWDGMDVRTVTKVLIEDFPSPACDGIAHLLKIWGDRYTFTGEIKNSAIAVDPGRFFLIITSNFHPAACFSKGEDREAILRRFAVIEMNSQNKNQVKRIRLNPEILTKQGNEDEDEGDEEEEGEPISMEQALMSLKSEPRPEMEVDPEQANRMNWAKGEIEKQDEEGKWEWEPGVGFQKKRDNTK